jgi:hypothetical protein
MEDLHDTLPCVRNTGSLLHIQQNQQAAGSADHRQHITDKVAHASASITGT